MLQFNKKKSIVQVKIFDLLDSGDLYDYNVLLKNPTVTVLDEDLDKSIPGVFGMTPETSQPPKLIRVVRYRVTADSV